MRPLHPFFIAILAALVPWVAHAAPALQPERPERLKPDRELDLEHLLLELEVDPVRGSIAGAASWKGVVLQDGVRHLRLDQEGLKVHEVWVDGKAAPFVLGAGSLSIDLGNPRPLRSPIALRIRYETRPGLGLHHRGPGPDSPDRHVELWSQGEDIDNRHWIPLWDHPGDRFQYEGVFRVPKGFAVHSNGSVVAEKEDGAFIETRFRLEPGDLVSYLVMLSVAPHRRAEIRHGEVTVQSFAGEDASQAALDESLSQLPAMFDLFAETTGLAYPFPIYRQIFVQRFIFGGMENTTATILDRRHLSPAFGSESTLAHELAHQWFGDILTCRDWTQLWLNEGFATYWADLWEERSLGPDAFAETFHHRVRGLSSGGRSGNPMVARFYSRAGDADNADVYGKGATVLQMLRSLLGDDTFFAGIGSYVADHRFGLVETEDLRRSFEDVSGRDLSWFFDQWVYLPGAPKLRVSDRVKDGSLALTVRSTSGEGLHRFTLPLDVELGLADGVVRHRLWIEGEGGTYTLPLPSGSAGPRYVALDPGGGLLADVEQEQGEAAWVHQLDSPSAHARARAMAALGDPDRAVGEVARTRVETMLSDPNAAAALRRAAARALGRWADERAATALATVLRRPLARDVPPRQASHEAELRKVIAEALGGADEESPAVPTLDTILRDDPDEGVRAAALRALARQLGPRALSRAIAGLRSTPGPRDAVAIAGADVLAEIGTIEHVELLAPFRRPSTGAALTHAALQASASLVAFAEAGPERERARAEVMRDAERLLDSAFLRTRQQAAGVLRRVGDASSVPALRARLTVEADPELRAALDSAIEAAKGRDRAAVEPRPNEVKARLDALHERVEGLDRRVDAAEKRP